MKLMLGALALGGLLAGCALLSAPPETAGNTAVYPQPRQGQAPSPATPAAPSTPSSGASMPTPPQQQAPPPRAFTLGAAAESLVGEAHTQEQSRNFGLAAETLERALSIEPRNPL